MLTAYAELYRIHRLRSLGREEGGQDIEDVMAHDCPPLSRTISKRVLVHLQTCALVGLCALKGR